LQPSLPPATSWSLRRRTKLQSAQLCLSLLHPHSSHLACGSEQCRTRSSFPSPSSTQSIEAHSEPRLGAFDLLSASCASITSRFGDRPPEFPRGCPSAFLSVLSISFLLTNSANPFAAPWTPAVTTLVRKEWSHQHIKRNKDPGVPLVPIC